MVPYTFQELLMPLAGTREGTKLAFISGQVKVEQWLLGEIVFNGSLKFADLDFYLEEKRRDITVRRRGSDKQAGPLLDWVEAKMCYTDCITRSFTRDALYKEMEYRDALKEDADKQAAGLKLLPVADRNTLLTSLLLAIHHDGPVWRHKYYEGFKNRGKYAGSAIEQAARKHVLTEFAPFIGRRLVEDFTIPLDQTCRLLAFVFRNDPP